MSDVERFSCSGCGKTYGWKLELAGRKVKCKCGQVMVVPAAPPAPESDGLFELAPEDPPPKPAVRRPQHVASHPAAGSIAGATAVGLTSLPATPRGSKKPAGARTGRTLSYAPGPTERQRERTAVANTIDMVRDVHVPLALLVVGFIAYLAYYMIRSHVSGGGLALVSLGLGGMMIFKAILMLGFAFVAAGPLGVSFGGIWTAALKLAAIAIFTDGVLTWVDYGVDRMTGMRGMFGSMISFPIALGLFWIMLIYLFSMDPGDSWMVVILLCVFDYFVRIVMLMLLLTIVLKLAGGASTTGLAGAAAIGGGAAMIGGSAGGGSGVAAEDAALAERLTELKETGFLLEAREYIAGGRQLVLKQSTEDWYAAGAKNVAFEVSKDINGKTEPETLFVELPDSKEQRSKCFDVLKSCYEKLGRTVDPDDLKDSGSRYIEIGIY